MRLLGFTTLHDSRRYAIPRCLDPSHPDTKARCTGGEYAPTNLGTRPGRRCWTAVRNRRSGARRAPPTVTPSEHSPLSTCRKSRGTPSRPHSGQHASPKSPSRVPPLRSMKRTPVADGRCRVPSPPLTPRLVASTTACHLGAPAAALPAPSAAGSRMGHMPSHCPPSASASSPTTFISYLLSHACFSPSIKAKFTKIRGTDHVVPPTRSPERAPPHSPRLAACVVYGRFVVSRGLTNR